MAAGEVVTTVDGRRLRLTNLDKVLYPATGTTKAEVIDYALRIAPVLLPHVAGRPVTRKRWPHGVGTAEDPQRPFFVKQLEPGAPDWLLRRTIAHSDGDKDYPLADSAAALVHFAQLAALELHVPQWRFDAAGQRGNPDRLVLDLDPGEGAGLAECAAVAMIARDLLIGMGLTPFPVTSGSKGIHLYAHLDGTQTSAQVSEVAHALARAIEADQPDLVVSTMAKDRRAGRVFIDWSQNNGKKTTIAPYSLRGTARPFVAAPRTWEELTDPDLAQLEFTEVLGRVARNGDLLASLDAASPRLAAYLDKRRSAQTPEPMPSTPRATDTGERRFVIQEHHASALHWDLRLEHDGVLVSWAVPKGLPETSTRNNLAVQTEDHPLEYLDFAGDIPRGQYGAGRMWLWDRGTYDEEKWREDEIIVTLHGRPGGPADGVRIVLIRTDGEGERSTWLLRRMKRTADGRAQPDGSPVVPHDEDDPLSPPPSPPASSAAGAAAHYVAPMLATPATPALGTAAATRTGQTPWVEMKWDGIRAIVGWDGGRVRIWGRNGTEITARYPELTAAGALTVAATSAVLDGEIVALDSANRPSFPLLQNRMHLTDASAISAEARRTPVSLFLFDILAADTDLTDLPLRDRRERLESLVAASASVAVPPVFDDVSDAWDAARALDLEGVMVKDPRSPYRAGSRSDAWLKLKLTRTQDVVIGGIRPGRGGRAGAIGSLLVGVRTPDGSLHYAGRVGTGFSDSAADALLRLLAPLGTDVNPFADVPAADAADAVWVEPVHVGEVEFAEWSPSEHLRHPRWRGLRTDIAASDVRRTD
ncbi:ATP-dependent DNA ligase [Microbacterium gorillae]|uniref:ATP-dependent DNA ligase n=1 Tax=Microbacterium gorillae TaxID=1231063 RepID=UPI000591616E|nr:ATP-dependent DNA ligase [Microbacterium gorillae]